METATVKLTLSQLFALELAVARRLNTINAAINKADQVRSDMDSTDPDRGQLTGTLADLRLQAARLEDIGAILETASSGLEMDIAEASYIAPMYRHLDI